VACGCCPPSLSLVPSKALFLERLGIFLLHFDFSVSPWPLFLCGPSVLTFTPFVFRRASSGSVGAQMASKEQIEDVFKLFDKKKQGYLEPDQFGMVIRALGKNPTQDQMEKILADVAKEQITIDVVKTTLRDKSLKAPQDQEKAMRDAFQALDRDGRGVIQQTELKQILGNLGDALTAQEVNSLMRDLKADSGGGIDYNALVDQLANGYTGDSLS
jgi:calmodulin